MVWWSCMPNFLDATYLVTTYGYIGLFLTVFFESGLFFALPGDSLLFTAGLLAPALHLSITTLFMLVLAAAILGNILGYVVGMQIDRLYKFAFFRKILKPEHIIEAQKFFAEHGRAAVILARFMPVVRTFVPIAAGAARMNFKKYAEYSVVGALAWSSAFLFSGYYLGKIFPHMSEYLTLVIIAVVLISILPGVYHWLRSRSQKGK